MCEFSVLEFLTAIGTLAAAAATAAATYFAYLSAKQSEIAAQDMRSMNKAKTRLDLVETAAEMYKTKGRNGFAYLEAAYGALKNDGWTKEDFAHIMRAALRAGGDNRPIGEIWPIVEKWE